MFSARRSFLVLAPLCLAGCGDREIAEGEESGKVAPATASSAQSSPGVDHTVEAHVGPVEYSYDTDKLTQADIQLTIPPAYDTEVYVTKLIPADRAAVLGEETCIYGESGSEQTCIAEKEPGLALGLLARPISHYRDAFAESEIPAEEIERIEVDDVEGFAFTAQAEGSGIEYCFLPVGERTLLLARQFAAGTTAGVAAIRAVLATLDLGA